MSHRTRVEPIRDGDDRSRPRSTGYGGSTSDDRGGGKLQTLCVRTCDGYYWPLSYPVPRRDIGKEAALCRASCDVEAKLYVRSGPGADIEDMKDLDGNAYTESPTALLYRKRLVDGCSCKPMPWTSTELARHDTYRSIEAERRTHFAEATPTAAAPNATSRPSAARSIAGALTPTTMPTTTARTPPTAQSVASAPDPTASQPRPSPSQALAMSSAAKPVLLSRVDGAGNAMPRPADDRWSADIASVPDTIEDTYPETPRRPVTSAPPLAPEMSPPAEGQPAPAPNLVAELPAATATVSPPVAERPITSVSPDRQAAPASRRKKAQSRLALAAERPVQRRATTATRTHERSKRVAVAVAKPSQSGAFGAGAKFRYPGD